MCDKIRSEESADIEMSKAQTIFKEERMAVRDVIAPHKRGGNREKVAIYEPSTGRWVIKLPKAIQTDGKSKITADSEPEVYHKAYELLCGKIMTLRDVYLLAMADRDEDPGLTDETQKRTRRDWERYYAHSALADRPISEIKASELNKFLKRTCDRYELTRNGYMNLKSILNLIYDYAVDEDIVDFNRGREVHPNGITFAPIKERIYATDQCGTILRYIEDHDKVADSIYYAAIYLMFYLCCRIGEVKALRWSDYDIRNETIRIEREVVTRGGKQVEVNHTKSAEHGDRTQFLSPEAIALLQRLRETSTSDLIFPSETGMYLRTDKFNERLKFICNKTNIPYCSSHKIRFWSVTTFSRVSGSDITAVGRYAGQRNKQTTLHYIRKAQDEDAQQAAAKKVWEQLHSAKSATAE